MKNFLTNKKNLRRLMLGALLFLFVVWHGGCWHGGGCSLVYSQFEVVGVDSLGFVCLGTDTPTMFQISSVDLAVVVRLAIIL